MTVSERIDRLLRPGAWWGLAVGWLVLAGCGVNRAAERAAPPPAALPNLQRASVALQERISREQQHVEAFSQELDALRAQEERLYAEIVEAEEAYQRLQGDADAALDDVLAVEGELNGARSALGARKAELERVRLEQQQMDVELAAAQEAVLAARAGTTSWIARQELAEQQLEDGRRALEDFRLRWRIPAESWTALLVQLGLGRLSLDPEAWAAPVGPLTAPTAVPVEEAPGAEATPPAEEPGEAGAASAGDGGDEPPGEPDDVGSVPASDDGSPAPSDETGGNDEPEPAPEVGSPGDPENDAD